MRFPSDSRCVDGAGTGWCCEGTGSSNCFVDQPSSCDEPDSVSCTNLARGTKQACCPSKTKCDNDFEASESNVRCQMAFDDLVVVAGVKRRWVVLPSTRSNTVSEGGGLSAAGGQTSQSSTVSLSGRDTAISSPSPSSTTPLPTPTTSSTASASASASTETNPPEASTPVSPFWTSKGSIASLILCIILSIAFLSLLAFSLHRQHRRKKKKKAAQQNHLQSKTRMSLPRGAYLPERPVYLAVETGDFAVNTMASYHGYPVVAHLEPGPGPGYYGALPMGLTTTGRDGEREREDEEDEDEEERLAELDNTQMKEVLNGEGP